MNMNSTINYSTFSYEHSTTAENTSSDGDASTPTFLPGVYSAARIWIWRVIPPIVIIIGSFGNWLTMVVLLRQLRNMSSTSMYLVTLACSDLMILYLGPVRQWILHIWDIDVRLLTNVGCIASTFLTYFSFQLSSWLLVAVTVERLISVLFPHKVKLSCTTKKSGITILVIIVCLVALNAHFFYGYSLYYRPFYSFKPLRCSSLPGLVMYTLFRSNTWPWIDFAISFAFPVTILVIANVVIIASLKRQTNRRRKMSMTDKEIDGHSVTVMLIALCVIYSICLIPSMVYFIVFPYQRVVALKMPFLEMARRMEYFSFVHAVVSCLSYINSTTNFILYFLSGSKFRSEVRQLFACKCHGVGKWNVFG